MAWRGSDALAVLVVMGALGGSALAQAPAEDLLKRAEAARPAAVETMRSLVEIDSGTGDAEGLGKIEAILVQRLQGLGAEVEVSPAQPSAGSNIVGRLDGRGQSRIMLMIHYDTVFPPGEAQRRPFRIEGDRIRGPGVADAKGGIAIVLHVLALLQETGFDDYGRLTVLFNPDEEMGSTGSRELIRRLAAEHEAVLSFEPPETDAVTVATNGINTVRLEVKGRASHAGSAPERGRNAAIELAHQLLQLDALGDPAKGTTVNWTVVRAGERRNIIPELATAEADMRYSVPGEPDRVLADAQRLIGEGRVPDTRTTVELRRGRPPLVRNEASERLAALATSLYGEVGRKLETVAMRFGTDAGYAYRPDRAEPAVLETLGVIGAGLHSSDEHALLTSIGPRIYLTTRLVMRLSESG